SSTEEQVVSSVSQQEETDIVSQQEEVRNAAVSEEVIAGTQTEEQKETILPVSNADVEFEITNTSSGSDEISMESEENWNEENEQEFSMNVVETQESYNEVSAELNAPENNSEVNEPVSEWKKTEEPEMKVEEQASEIPAVSAEEEARTRAEEEKKQAAEEIQRKAQERIARLKELSLKLKTPQGLKEMEHEPAYKRRNIQLDNVPHSSESQVSRFTLTENEDKKIEIKPNNSFLHDNVD
ncbi:MAG TPA: hypothetical protein VFU15_07255, partial [Bacteroidia bacterium]|nr:hypothetical protein [Bacteroidia bacterium]